MFIVAILAASIGANTAVFTLVDRVLLRPFSFPNLPRLVEITGIAPEEFETWRARVPSFERSSFWRIDRVLLSGVEQPENLSAFDVGPGLFDTLGVRARLGRTFLERDHRTGSPPVVVIGDRLWKQSFHGDPSIVGREILLDGKGYTVVGVMGPDFVFTSPKEALWLPVTVPLAAESGLRRHFSGVALLAGGADPGTARREFSAVANSSARPPGVVAGWNGEVRPFAEQFAKSYRTASWTCQAAVGLVLLIACANAGGLLLARNVARTREFAVRAALGAGRGRIVGRIVAESALLAGAAAALAVPVAVLLLKTFVSIWPIQGAVDPSGATLSAVAFLVAAGGALVAALLCSVAPCVQVLRTDLADALKSNAAAISRSGRLGSWTVAAEAALAMILAAGAGLMLASLHNLLSVRLGFEPEHVLTARIGIPAGLATLADKSTYYDQLIAATPAIPGVQSAAVVTLMPFGGFVASTGLTAEGRERGQSEKGSDLLVQMRSVSPEYFRTVGVRMLAGRAFDDRDGQGAPAVTMVNRTLAMRFWGRTDVTGMRLSTDSHPGPGDWRTVVGVVEDSRDRSLTASQACELFFPYTQNLMGAQVASLVVRTSTPPLAIGPALARAVHEVNPDQPVSEVKAMDALVREASAQPRFHTSLLAAFAGFALLLAASGVFAVAAYSTAQRRGEIAIRSALGARPAELFRWTLARNLKPVAWGCLAGLIGALWAARLLAAELVTVSASDPAVLLGAASILAAIALTGALGPAIGAARTSPSGIPRAE